MVASVLCEQEAKVAKRKNAPFPRLTAADAHTALRWLHATGVVTAKQIAGALKKRQELVSEIKARLKELASLQALGGDSARFVTSSAALRRPTRRRHRKATAKAVAAWRAQGRYLAAVRLLSKTARLKVKKIREAKGVGMAIAAAKRMAKS